MVHKLEDHYIKLVLYKRGKVNLMNNARRKMIRKAIGMLEMREDVDQVLDILENVLYDE